mmetsp:Transcript_14196/g.23320  ORF Transcript_14196/g.23320 Transcript_14196/m.23320 type:complete len:429 (-) Transcript_14196:357-1643(-)
MMLPTRALVFIVAKQGYHFCRRGFGGNKQQPMTSWPSILFTSTQSDSEHNIINDNYFLGSGKNHVAATTSKNGLTRFNVKLKRTIFKRRRRGGIPRTIIINRSNIQQHIVKLLFRLGHESCTVATILLLLYRVVMATTTSLSHLSLRKFVTMNLTRWVAASVAMKLLTLHSQITAVGDQSEYLTNNANKDENWFLRGEFHVNLQDDAAQDDYLFSSNTSFYNNTARIDMSTSPLVSIRQVPSDGSCLFHAIGARLLHDKWLQNSIESQLPPMSKVIEYSSKLRQLAVNVLQDNPQRQFSMIRCGEEVTETASSLVQLAADQYGISPNEYLASIQNESVWGGGPEIIALASELNRQIVVLEPEENMNVSSDVCYLKVRARFGNARYDSGSCIGDVIYILWANQQFPESHGRGRKELFNHYLAVFPLQSG